MINIDLEAQFCLDTKSCETCKVVDKCHRELSPTIRITTKCTQSCSHCCFSCSPKKEDMMTIKMATKIGKFIQKNNIGYIQIMGGEFYLNSNWVDIMDKFVLHVRQIRLVTNGDWAGNENEAKKVISYVKEMPNIYISLSFDKWHTNQYTEKAKELCIENNIPFNIATEEKTYDENIVPVGRSELDCGFFGMFSCYCHNPFRKYSFLIDEGGDIYKCGFGIWNYANINEYLKGGFSKRFKEFGEKFYDVHISSCRSCVRAYHNQKRKEKS